MAIFVARLACCQASRMIATGPAAASGGGAKPNAKEMRRPKPKPPPVGEAPDSTPKTIDAYAAMKPREPMVPFTYTVPSTTPPPGYVDVAISHCGICHSDIHQIDDAWKVATFPLVPGHEIVGTIAAVGEDAETRAKFAVGDRAAIGVPRGNCGCCAACDEGLEQVCPKILKTYAGPGKDKGGFASMIRYPTAWTFSPPAALASELVGPLMCAGITTYSPLKRFLKPGGKVGVIGIGGLGHIGLQFASHLGYGEVVAISRSPGKEAEAKGFGASDFLITEDAEAMARHAGTFDVILNTVSGHAPIDPYLSLLKPRGTLACVGLPEKDQKSQLWFQSMVPTEKALCGSVSAPQEDRQAASPPRNPPPPLLSILFRTPFSGCHQLRSPELTGRPCPPVLCLCAPVPPPLRAVPAPPLSPSPLLPRSTWARMLTTRRCSSSPRSMASSRRSRSCPPPRSTPPSPRCATTRHATASSSTLAATAAARRSPPETPFFAPRRGPHGPCNATRVPAACTARGAMMVSRKL